MISDNDKAMASFMIRKSVMARLNMKNNRVDASRMEEKKIHKIGSVMFVRTKSLDKDVLEKNKLDKNKPFVKISVLNSRPSVKLDSINSPTSEARRVINGLVDLNGFKV